jgi:hypothetical protein
LIPWLLALACTPAEPVETGLEDTAPEVVDTGPAGDCVVLPSGEWSVRGAAFGMLMTVTLTFDESDCTFAFSDWSMNHGADETPQTGAVSGTEVTLGGTTTYWESCAGSTASEGRVITGLCTDDTAGFEMSAEEG